MANKNDTELKAYFESGDKPTEDNFIDLIDSKINYDAIVDDVTTGGSAVPLSAEQGKDLKNTADALDTTVSNLSADDISVTSTETGVVTVQDAIDDLSDKIDSGGVDQLLKNEIGTSYTFIITDVRKHVTFNNGAAITVTVPPNVDVAFGLGARIDISQLGAGQVTLAQGAGVTIQNASSLALSGQYSGGSIIQITADEWLLVGDLA